MVERQISRLHFALADTTAPAITPGYPQKVDRFRMIVPHPSSTPLLHFSPLLGVCCGITSEGDRSATPPNVPATDADLSRCGAGNAAVCRSRQLSIPSWLSAPGSGESPQSRRHFGRSWLALVPGRVSLQGGAEVRPFSSPKRLGYIRLAASLLGHGSSDRLPIFVCGGNG